MLWFKIVCHYLNPIGLVLLPVSFAWGNTLWVNGFGFDEVDDYAASDEEVTDGNDDANEDSSYADMANPTTPEARKCQTQPKPSSNKKKRSVRKKSAGATRTAKKARRNRGADNDDVDSALAQYLRHKMRPSDNPAAAMAALSGHFTTTATNLGSRVLAARACPKFRQFLTREEKAELDEMDEWIVVLG